MSRERTPGDARQEGAGAGEVRTAPDVAGMLRALGVPDFPYVELVGTDRIRHAAAALQALLSREDVATLSGAVEPRAGVPARAVPLRDEDVGYTVVVVSPAAGSGCTTVTATLAHAVASLGRRCLAVDLHPSNALAPRRGGDTRQLGVAALAADPSPRAVELRTHGGVTWLPFGHADADALARAERVVADDPRWLSRSVAAVAADAEFILIDTPPGISPWVAQALSVADEVLVTLAPDSVESAALAAADRFYREHLRDGRPEYVGYVLNRFDPRRPADRRTRLGLTSLLGARLRGVVHHDAAVQQQIGSRRLAAEACPDSHMVTDVAAIAESLVARGDAVLASLDGRAGRGG